MPSRPTARIGNAANFFRLPAKGPVAVADTGNSSIGVATFQLGRHQPPQRACAPESIMNASVKRLEETGSALRDALAQQDWAAISMLDRECRQAVEEAMQQPSRDEAVIRQRLQELLGLYRELVTTCQTEQRRIAGELLQLNQSQQGAKVYRLFG